MQDDPLASGTPPTLQSRSSWTRREDLFAEPFSNGAAPSDAHGFDWKSNIWSSSTNEVEVESDSSPYASTSALPIATSLSRQRRTSTEGIIGNSDESNHFGASITPQAYGFSPFAQAEASSSRLTNDVESSQDGFDEEDEEDEEDISELGPDEVFSLLQEACTSGDLRGVRRVMRGSSLPLVDRQSSSGMTPLHYAASRGRLHVVRYLIETCGATQMEDGEGETALHKAAYSGHFDVVRRLVEAGWRVDAADTDGWTPLHNAASRGYLAIVRYLVGSSLADQDAQSKLGFTPLMSAAAKGYLPVVQYLIKNRANPLLRNSFLETALEIAAGIFEVHICRLLAESEKASLPEPSLYNSFLLHTTVPVLVYENQRLAIPAIGRQTPRWTSKALSKNDARTAFTLASLGGSDEVAVIKDTIGLPVVGHETSLVLPTAEVLVSTMVPSEPAWFWLSDWTTDLSDPRSSPVDGWSYASSFDATVWTAEPSDELQVLLNGNGSAFGGGKKWVRRRLAVRLLRRRVDLEPWGFGEEGEATTSATDYLTKVQLLVVGLHHNGGNRAGSVRSSRTVPVVDEAEREVERRKRCARLESAITSLAQGIATDSVEARRSRATEELKKYEVMLASLRLDRAEDEEGEDEEVTDTGRHTPSSLLSLSRPESIASSRRSVSLPPPLPRHPSFDVSDLAQSLSFRVPTQESAPRLHPIETRSRSTSQPVRGAARWVPDAMALECPGCTSRFSFFLRKHHCRLCGLVFCDGCTSHRDRLDLASVVMEPGNVEERLTYRVCGACHTQLLQSPYVEGPPSASILSSIFPPSHSVATSPNLGASAYSDTGASEASELSDCPVCGITLLEVGRRAEQETHVAECLDRGGGAISNHRYLVFNLREGNPLIDTECSICFEDVQVGDRIARLSCLCYYHEACISSWLSRGHHCPFHQE